MSIVSLVKVTTAPTELFPGAGKTLPSKHRVLVKNGATAIKLLSSATQTVGQGFPVAANETITLDITNDQLFAVTAAGESEVSVLAVVSD